MSPYVVGGMARVARLEQLLDRVRHNAALARAPRPSAAQAYAVDSSEPDVDYDDVEVVVVEVEESVAPAVPNRQAIAAAVAADDFSDLNPGLPEGVRTLDEDSDRLPPVRGLSSAPSVPSSHSETRYSLNFSGSAPVGETEFGGMMFAEELAIPLQPKRDSQRPTMVEAEPTAPTMEQLGATIGLEVSAGPAPELELDMHPLPGSDASDLELTLPSRGFAGAYHEDLAPPPDAQHDLATFDQGQPNFANDANFTAQPVAPQDQSPSLGPVLVERSLLSPAIPVSEIVDNRPPAAQSFVAMLDDSLSLSKN